jgi:hypothetical protein
MSNTELQRALADVKALADRIGRAVDASGDALPELIGAKALVAVDRHRAGLDKIAAAVEAAAPRKDS